MESWHGYPSIFNLGHKAVEDIFKEEVLVQEKVDGSQFSFGLFDTPEGRRLRCRSKNAELNIVAPEGMFARAIDQVKAMEASLVPGWTYRAEYLAKPKHNALAYDRVPKGNLILFDINTGHEVYTDHTNIKIAAVALGIDSVPVIFQGLVEDINVFRGFLDRESILGDQKIEGVVIKNYQRFGIDKVDDTNLAPKHYDSLSSLAKKNNATLIVKSFLDVPLETCIERDIKRSRSVGEGVIRGMYRDFLMPAPETYSAPGMPPAVICDIDGTLAHKVGRSPFEWHKVDQDRVNERVADILREQYCMPPYRRPTIILFSGRDSVCLPETKAWLDQNAIPHDLLVMRPQGNTEKDSIIKRRMFDEYVRDKYDVKFVLDDRNQVVEMWRSLGLTCLQVALGDF